MTDPSPKAAEDIAEHIRSQIATGALRPGELLPPEGALLERFAVARPTMRGALRILESDGLIRIERGHTGGPRVVEAAVATLARRVGLHLQLRGADLRELIEAQAMLQPAAAAQAARVHDEADIARLRDAVAACANATSTGEYIEAAERFGEALLDASHNRVLALYAELTSSLLRTELIGFVRSSGMTDASIGTAITWSTTQFARLVDLIEAGEADAAERFWADTLRAAGAAPSDEPSPFQLYRGVSP